MTEYQRFISYVYKYQRGIKENNVGYLRVEIKQDLCKLLISIRDKNPIDKGNFTVYLYYTEDENIFGIKVDKYVLNNGKGEFKNVQMENELTGNIKKLSEIDGVIIFYSDALFYATAWTDKPFNIEKFKDYYSYKEELSEDKIPQNNKNEVEEKDLNDNIYMENIIEDQPKKKENTNIKKEDEKINLETQNQEEFSQNRINSKEIINLENSQLEENNLVKGYYENQQDETIIDGNNLENEKMYFRNLYLKKARLDVSEEEHEKDIEKVNIEDKHKATENANVETQHKVAQNIYGENLKVEKDLLNINHIESRKDDGFKYEPNKALENMFMEYPKLPAFSNNEIIDCVRIKPNDIGFLDMANWRLVENSFLIHGFYNYKYLMIGKVIFQDKDTKFVIGIPGIYTNKEKYLANMFGFYQFITLKRSEYKTGQFGYWITEIKSDERKIG